MSLRWLSPPWLFGTAAIILPILVHLWGRGLGREVLVASLRWFPEGTPRLARRFRPSDPWLLVVRCLLLLGISLALAQPRVVHHLRSESKTWILVEPSILDLELGRGELSKVRGRYPEAEVRWLLPKTPEWRDDEDLSVSSRWLEDQWAVLRAVDRRAPPGVRLVFLTTDRLAALPGARPTVGHELSWITVASSARIESANAVEHPVVRRASSSGEVRLERASASDGAGEATLLVSMVVGSDRSEDAVLVREAVEMVRGRGWSLRWAEESEVATAWIILGSPDLNPDGKPRWVLRDGEGSEFRCRGPVRPSGVRPGPFSMNRCLGSPTGTPIWSVRDGQPLLVRASSEPTSYRFSSRFHPSWSGLDASGWADWLEDSWQQEGLLALEEYPRGFDLRQAFFGEQEPRRVGAPSQTLSSRLRTWPETLLWMLVAALLILERWMQWVRR